MTEGTQPSVCVVVVSYNTRAMLLECLAHLQKGSPDGLCQEIIVVDNGSTDGSVEAVRQAFPLVRFIANPANAGFAAANNQAIRCTATDYVLLLNSDVFVQAETVQRLVAYLHANAGVGMAGCRLLNADGTLQQSCFRYATLWRSIGDALLLTNALQFLPAIDDYRRWPHDRPRRVSSLSGACLMVRRAAIAQVGLLDERFFMYAEDGDWCRRFWAAGWQVAFTPAATAVHLGGGSQAGGVSRQALARSEESNRRYMLKYYGAPGCAIWSASALLGSAARLTLSMARHRGAGGHRGTGPRHHAMRIAWHLAACRRMLSPAAA